MSRRLRREISIPLWWFIAGLLAFSLSLMALLTLCHTDKQPDFWRALADEIIKAGAFGGILAALLHNRFEALFEEGSDAILKTHGIEGLHPSRERVADD